MLKMTLKDINMHPRTAKMVDSFISKPSNALMLIGPAGSGKKYLAAAIASEILKVPLKNYRYFYRVSVPEGKQQIPIDAIRTIVGKLQLKADGIAGIRRVVIIEEAEFLSEEAQNALLKVLEEPPTDTLFVLTASSALRVAPTIASRCQQINIYNLSLDQALASLVPKYAKRKVIAAWNLSQGVVGLMLALLDGSRDHPLKHVVEEAKTWLKLKPGERLVALDKYSKDRNAFLQLLDAIARTMAALQKAAIERQQHGISRALVADRKLVADIIIQVQAGLNLKLATTRLALGIRSLL